MSIVRNVKGFMLSEIKTNKNILITGICGSGGSYLGEYILENHPEYNVHGISRWHSTTNNDNIKNIKNKITIHECDLLDIASIVRILRDIKPIKIFNLASHANVRVAFDTPLAVLNNNVMSTANLLESIRLECPDCVFQHCSTSEIYGNPIIFPMKEDHPSSPVNPYSVSKQTQESLTICYHKSYGLKVVITRAFAYINPRRKDLFATSFAYQIAEIEAKKRILLRHGNLESIRTLMDVRDMARAYWIASEKCVFGEPYNIGGNNVLSVGDFLNILISHAKETIILQQDKKLLRPIDVTKQICDSSKFDNLTGFKPEYTLDDSVEFLLNHCRNEVK